MSASTCLPRLARGIGHESRTARADPGSPGRRLVRPTRYDAVVTDDPTHGPIGRTRLGNTTNGGAPRPPGACRVLMIGDMIGKPGRIAVETILPALRDERGIDFVTANGENVAGGMGLTPAHGGRAVRGRRRRRSRAATTSGTSARSTRISRRTDRVLRPLNYGTHDVPGRGWGVYDALDGIRARRDQPPGPHLHAADREPVH